MQDKKLTLRPGLSKFPLLLQQSQGGKALVHLSYCSSSTAQLFQQQTTMASLKEIDATMKRIRASILRTVKKTGHNG